MNRIAFGYATALLLLSAGSLALGQLDDSYELTWYTVDAGGTTSSAGGGFELGGTLGQPDATPAELMTGGAYALTGGFWAVAMPTCTVFLAADLNLDCAVDGADMAMFLRCMTGPNVPYDPVNPPPGCQLAASATGESAADLDADQDVDQVDFGLFQRCYNSANSLANPGCAR